MQDRAFFWYSIPEKQEIMVQLGAQVMLLRNLEMERRSEMLVNGSRGVITSFWKKQASDPDKGDDSIISV